jgi:hypothetical protein
MKCLNIEQDVESHTDIIGTYMHRQSKLKSGCVRWISDKTMASIVNKRAQAVLGVSGKKFIRKRKAGAYATLDADECPGIIELALLVPSVKAANSGARKRR